MKRLALRSVVIGVALFACSHIVAAQKIAVIADKLYTMGSGAQGHPCRICHTGPG